ncbi:SDR family NAD(P)-dependent oxidoreductase [Pseudooceanicola sp.]|uniref:SDR family NAD(P)-dependent oxidoreductase n=1 Tax=Pseudooceanicola sp. TaxID=1914328 RepID=UPI004058272E
MTQPPSETASPGDFSGKVALVTGGRTGMGRAIACRLRDRGAHVVTAQRGADDEFDSVSADFADPAAPQTVIEAVTDRAGRLDVLVNNAGMMPDATAEEMTPEAWHRCLTINLTAPFLTIRAALPHLRRAGGSIVNIGSVEGLAANPRHAAYCASKSGLHGLTRAIAIDHGGEGIRCNAVAPGWIDTGLNDAMVGQDAARYREGLARIHPVGRTGAPDEIAALVVFLASAEASFITGQIFTADGGRMAQLSLP